MPEIPGLMRPKLIDCTSCCSLAAVFRLHYADYDVAPHWGDLKLQNPSKRTTGFTINEHKWSLILLSPDHPFLFLSFILFLYIWQLV